MGFGICHDGLLQYGQWRSCVLVGALMIVRVRARIFLSTVMIKSFIDGAESAESAA